MGWCEEAESPAAAAEDAQKKGLASRRTTMRLTSSEGLIGGRVGGSPLEIEKERHSARERKRDRER